MVGASSPADSAVAVSILWARTALPPMPEALAALQSLDAVRVDADPWLVFRPASDEATTCLILYPGGRVYPRAYAPTARALADVGHLVAIVPMPLNLAFFAPGRATEVMAAFPGIDSWPLGFSRPALVPSHGGGSKGSPADPSVHPCC